MEIVDKRRLKRQEVIDKVRQYSEQLNYQCTVILIGSYARGDFNLWSDIDLLIIGKFEHNPLRRIENFDFPPGYEVILLTPAEIATMKEKRNKLVVDAFTEGIIVRDDLGYKK
jgi:predicted nucleotidyltransferase